MVPPLPFWMMPENVVTEPAGAAILRTARASGELFVMVPKPEGAGIWFWLSSPLRSKVPPDMTRRP